MRFFNIISYLVLGVSFTSAAPIASNDTNAVRAVADGVVAREGKFLTSLDQQKLTGRRARPS
jgi:hypothetical protein